MAPRPGLGSDPGGAGASAEDDDEGPAVPPAGPAPDDMAPSSELDEA